MEPLSDWGQGVVMRISGAGLLGVMVPRGIAVGTVALLLSASAASAMTVSTTQDSSKPGDGACSLREAIAAVNSGRASKDCGPLGSGGTTPITLPAGHYDLTAGELGSGPARS